MLDAMAIRKHIDYNTHSTDFSGYVNLGSGNDVTSEAKEALVFLLVGLNASWKAPIAYFFTAGLSAETQKELVTMCIEKLEDYGFSLHALTMDGHPTNYAMCRLLGANLDMADHASRQTYFESTKGQKIFIIFDACHMLKLVRNTLQACNNLIDHKGKLVSWHYIADLNDLQNSVGLRLANRLTSRHVEFQQQKMKVSLATQLLSSSVAKALRTVKDIDVRFLNSDATAEFIEVI